MRKNKYMSEAYDSKKWAFVSDYCRVDVVYEHGGIYMDADVELLKPLDVFLGDKAFCGMENGRTYVPSGTYGAVKGNRILGEVLQLYEGLSFFKDDGSMDMLANPHRFMEVFLKYGLIEKNIPQIVDDFAVYPTDVFTPMHPTYTMHSFTDNTHAIHHFGASWESEGHINMKIENSKVWDSLFKDFGVEMPVYSNMNL